MPVEFVLSILGIAKPSLASLLVQLFHGEAGITALCIWKERFFHFRSVVQVCWGAWRIG